MEKGCLEYADIPHVSIVTTTLSTEDEQEPEEQYSKGSMRPRQQDTEVNDVMERIYRRRREKEAAERRRTTTKCNVKVSMSGEKRKGGIDVDVGEDESADDEPSASHRRTLVYSADVKDLVCDNNHETIEKSPKIEKIIKDAIRFLTYLPSIHNTWSKKPAS
jgi:hypothetical protein